MTHAWTKSPGAAPPSGPWDDWNGFATDNCFATFARMPSKRPKPSELREAFKTDLAACWRQARSLHPKDTPYAFALHGLEGTPHLYPCVLTEEGLTEVAKRYVTQGHYETLVEARKELRYSMEDSPHHTELDDHFATVDALIEPVEDTLDETEGYALLAKAAMDAFAALDKQGLFGKGRQREKLLLMIDTSFAEKDWTLPSVKKLNHASLLNATKMRRRSRAISTARHTFIFPQTGVCCVTRVIAKSIHEPAKSLTTLWSATSWATV